MFPDFFVYIFLKFPSMRLVPPSCSVTASPYLLLMSIGMEEGNLFDKVKYKIFRTFMITVTHFCGKINLS